MSGLPANPQINPARHWPARLDLCVAMRGDRSALVHSAHLGPLRVQRTLYPEGPSIAHVLLVHPPGGIAGGDDLVINIALHSGAASLITTPGAAKWYKAHGDLARQHTQLSVSENANLEWLPQENIYFDHAQARNDLSVHVAQGARCAGWDISVLGRRHSGEDFANGRVQQRIDLHYAGELLWRERMHLRGGDPLLSSPVGWAGHHVSGTFWLLGAGITECLVDSLQRLVRSDVALGATRIREHLLLVRALGSHVEAVRNSLIDAWCLSRHAFLGRAPQVPRIWAT